MAALAWALSRSATGRRVRAIGSLPAAERLDGSSERRWIVALFAVSGLAAALVGLIRTSQLGTGLPTAAIGVELTVVTSVLLGGGRLAGGRGSVIGTLIALLMISVVDNGLSLTNVTAYASQVFHALLLIIALVIDRPRRRSRETSAARNETIGRTQPSQQNRSERRERGADQNSWRRRENSDSGPRIGPVASAVQYLQSALLSKLSARVTAQ